MARLWARTVATRIAVLMSLAFSVFPASSGLAEETGLTDGVTDLQTFRIPAIQVARTLMHAGKWDEAREILKPLSPEDEQGIIERLFLLGVTESRLAMHESAAQRFEAILVLQPDLTRVRLELARVYHALGRDSKARFHFRASLDDALPASVEDAVESWLDRIDGRKRWSASLSFSLLPESNPSKRTQQREIRIGGIPFQLEDDSRVASGTGFLANAGIQFSPVITGDLRAVMAGSVAGKFYRNSDWNDLAAQADIGISQLYDQGSLSGGVRLGRRWLGGDRYSDGAGPYIRGRRYVSPSVRLDLSLSAEHLDHRTQTHLDGRGLRFGAGVDWSSKPRTAWRFSLDLEKTGARRQHLRNRLRGFGVTLTHAFRGGISVAPGITVHRRQYRGVDPLFQNTRRDRLVRLSLNLLHRRLQLHGFAPYIGLAREQNRSTIVINEYVNNSAVIGISRTF